MTALPDGQTRLTTAGCVVLLAPDRGVVSYLHGHELDAWQI